MLDTLTEDVVHLLKMRGVYTYSYLLVHRLGGDVVTKYAIERKVLLIRLRSHAIYATHLNNIGVNITVSVSEVRVW
jgi:hypothetical protein